MSPQKIFGSFGLFASVLMLASCNASSTSGSYDYLYCVNCSDGNNQCQTDQNKCGSGCTTGSHHADSQEAECAALNDSAQNNGCAAQWRADQFKSQGCPGTFTSQ